MSTDKIIPSVTPENLKQIQILMWENVRNQVEVGAKMPASNALRYAFATVVGKSPLTFKGLNRGGFKNFETSDQYEVVKGKFLKDLQRFARRLIKQKTQKEFDDHLHAELGRGVDQETLREIGFDL